MNTTYTITGIDKSGKRFKIENCNPYHFNIWRGTLWANLPNGKRKRVLTYYN